MAKSILYPLVTITMNRMGCLHIWKGRKHVNTTEPLNHKVDGEESELFYQNDADVEAVREHLSAEQWKDLEGGWTVYTRKFPEDYFPETNIISCVNFGR